MFRRLVLVSDCHNKIKNVFFKKVFDSQKVLCSNISTISNLSPLYLNVPKPITIIPKR